MPFGQKLKSGMMSGINWTKNLLQKKLITAEKQAIGILDQGMKTGSGIYEALKPALKDLAPETLQGGLNKLNTHVERAQGKHNTLRNTIDSGEQRVSQNIGQVMGNLRKQNIDIGLYIFIFSNNNIKNVIRSNNQLN